MHYWVYNGVQRGKAAGMDEIWKHQTWLASSVAWQSGAECLNWNLKCSNCRKIKFLSHLVNDSQTAEVSGRNIQVSARQWKSGTIHQGCVCTPVCSYVRTGYQDGVLSSRVRGTRDNISVIYRLCSFGTIQCGLLTHKLLPNHCPCLSPWKERDIPFSWRESPCPGSKLAAYSWIMDKESMVLTNGSVAAVLWVVTKSIRMWEQATRMRFVHRVARLTINDRIRHSDKAGSVESGDPQNELTFLA